MSRMADYCCLRFVSSMLSVMSAQTSDTSGSPKGLVFPHPFLILVISVNEKLFTLLLQFSRILFFSKMLNEHSHWTLLNFRTLIESLSNHLWAQELKFKMQFELKIIILARHLFDNLRSLSCVLTFWSNHSLYRKLLKKSRTSSNLKPIFG